MRLEVEVPDYQPMAEAAVMAAAELGYDFSVEQLERAWVDAQNLDVDELASVAGGGGHKNVYKPEGEDEYGHDAHCLTAWHCYAVTCFNDSKVESMACWAVYLCQMLNKENGSVDA